MTIRRRLVLMSVAAFVVVLVASGAVVLGLLRGRLINDVDASLNERQVALEQLLELVPIEQLEGLAAERPGLGGADLAVIGLGPDGSIIASAPSGPAADPDPLPVLDSADVDRLRAGDTPFTVGGSDGYRVTAAEPAGGEVLLVLAQPLDDVALTMRRTLLVLLVVGAGTAVILGGAIWFLIRRELRPLDAMAHTADRIAESDLSRRVAIERSSNEVGRLGGALNSMLDRIEEAVAARTESEEKMRRFVADASHELRTPLTSIRGYAELHRAGADSPEHVARSFERIEREAGRMGGLVEDLVLLARLDQERPFAKEAVDVAHIAREAVTDAGAAEPDRPITVDVGAGDMVVNGDADRLRQVVANLLGNVHTHTAPGTPAAVSVDRADDRVVVVVSDEGTGMDAEASTRAFDRFYQANPDRTTPGSGLGLAIVRSIIERHGGTVDLHSAPGTGTTVTLQLPAA
ncbi:MAG: HAMP domain-containing histidine kinase [Acidimicrobiia bacterium]|nr:HAMP domain-containing histidine kinase [Acidimicrobiia bacterium]RZV45451.1 MAG: HAMP domain-containing histidine kinase [Acidimicrobiia bacterium]